MNTSHFDDKISSILEKQEPAQPTTEAKDGSAISKPVYLKKQREATRQTMGGLRMSKEKSSGSSSGGSCAGGLIALTAFAAGGYLGFAQATGTLVDPVLYKALLVGPTAAGTAISTVSGMLGGGVLGLAVGAQAGDSLEQRVVGGLGGGACGSLALGGIAGGCSLAYYGVSTAFGYGVGYLVGKFAAGH